MTDCATAVAQIEWHSTQEAIAMQNRCCDSAGTDDCRCEEEQWIKVGQELPPNGKFVLWYDEAEDAHPFVVGKRDGQSVDWGGDLNQSLSSFTHWMYIPAPPR